jgi:hypothetical protein
VVHSLVAHANSIPGAEVLVLRDPDNIQLELFFEPSEGPANDVGPGVVVERPDVDDVVGRVSRGATEDSGRSPAGASV